MIWLARVGVWIGLVLFAVGIAAEYDMSWWASMLNAAAIGMGYATWLKALRLA